MLYVYCNTHATSGQRRRVSDLKANLHDNPIQEYFQKLIQPNTPYARCAAEELISPGILPNVNHICKTCSSYAKGKKCNPRALVHGYFCGKPPLVLAQLDSVESSIPFLSTTLQGLFFWTGFWFQKRVSLRTPLRDHPCRDKEDNEDLSFLGI